MSVESVTTWTAVCDRCKARHGVTDGNTLPPEWRRAAWPSVGAEVDSILCNRCVNEFFDWWDLRAVSGEEGPQ